MKQNSYHLQKFGMQLSPLTSNHLAQVLTWRNDESVRQNMLNTSIIKAQEHQAWLKRICGSETEFHFIISYKNSDIGVANIKLSGKNAGEAGLYLCDEEVKGSAYAFLPSLMLLEFGFEHLGLKKIDATVLPHNKAALRFNLNQGYKIIEETSEHIKMQVSADNFNHYKLKYYRFFDR
jgi:UDP-4-amino-4,6-dideoxy-N-acetyl-beta-L-altrosamine N-acetyltransferase